jgi:glyoxylase-like metal-dependent hydrolase (beta-lactamase superfamily II)
MFVVTKAGVIATDRIGYLRPQVVKTYIDEISKVTSRPFGYVIYSHHHYDHIAGGKPFKDLGARFIAHRLAKEHLTKQNNPDVVISDETVDNKRVISLGGTTLELLYVGRNHSDNSLVMRMPKDAQGSPRKPKEKVIFAVDFLPIHSVLFRNGPDTFIPDYEASVKRVLELDWERKIPGHPGPGGRLGTKDDVKGLQQYMTDLSAEVHKAADAGKCWDKAMKEIKLPKYETLGNYATYLAGNIERYCSYWGRGY